MPSNPRNAAQQHKKEKLTWTDHSAISISNLTQKKRDGKVLWTKGDKLAELSVYVEEM